MSKQLLRNGLIVSGFMNIFGVLFFSRAFTNVAINNSDPMVMSNFGLLMIVVWGLVFVGAAFINSGVKWLIGAFAVEKFVYVVVWMQWISNNSLASLYSKDIFAGIFYSIYGPNDLAFMLFFAWAFLFAANRTR